MIFSYEKVCASCAFLWLIVYLPIRTGTIIGTFFL